MTDDTFERDLRWVLSSGVPAVAPASLRAVALETPPLRPVRFVLSASAATGAVAVVVVFVAALIGYAMNRTAELGGPGGRVPAAIQWQTETVSFAASSLAITAAGRTFTGVARPSVRSDPGDSTFSTLEVEWREQDREQRLYLYFAADERNWWVSEIRTRDGLDPADWVYYRGSFFKSPLGREYAGDVEVSGTGERGTNATLRIKDLRLAFVPFVASSLEGCRPVLDPKAPEPDPLDSGGPPAGTALAAGMTAEQVAAALEVKGFCYTFRLEWDLSDYPGNGYAQIWCIPPPGRVEAYAYGTSGELIAFVRTEPRPRDPSVQSTVGCEGRPAVRRGVASLYGPVGE